MEHLRTIVPDDFQSSTELPPGIAPPDRSIWDRLSTFEPNWRRLRRNRIVVGQPAEPASVAFEVLATKVLRQMRRNGWSTVAITSPTAGCGKSVVSLNLALALAGIGESQTVLLDLDLQRSRLERLLGVSPTLPFTEFLDGRRAVEESFLRWGDRLAMGVAHDRAARSAGPLSTKTMTRAVKRVRDVFKPAVVMVDLPPVFSSSEVHSFLSSVDCVLIVAAAGASRVAEIDACEREIAGETNVLGIVLNKCRFLPFVGSYYY